MPEPDRLERQLAFIRELDKLKAVERRTILLDRSRRENSAEHSWHIAMMALLLSEHSDAERLDALRVLAMLLVHDVVEIDAGDTFCYDEAGMADKTVREGAAAERLFGLLPADQAAWFRALWEEFEAGETTEARFANALDRLQPMLHNYYTDGQSWNEYGVTHAMVIERNAPIASGSQALWDRIRAMVDDALSRGILKP